MKSGLLRKRKGQTFHKCGYVKMNLFAQESITQPFQ